MKSPGGKGEASQPMPRRQVVLTLAGVMLAMFLSSLDQTIVGTAMPQIIADLGGFAHYTWVTTAYLVGSTTVVPIVGRLTDMYGRKWFYIAGIAIFLLGSALSGLSQTMTQLIVFRAFQGIGGGIMIANAFIVIGDLFPPAERGKYQGLISAVFGLSAVIGPALGGFVTDNLSWHWIFYINFPIGVPVIVLFVRLFPQTQVSRQQHKLDYLGVIALILSVIPIMLALSWGGSQYEWASPQVTGSLAIGGVMALTFVMIERRAAEPIIPLAIFSNPVVSISLLVIFLTGFGMFGGIVFVPLFFQGVLGASATSTGSFLTPMMLGVVAGSFISGQALSRLGGHYRIQGLKGLAIMGIGTFLLSRMNTDTSYARAVLDTVILGIGMGTTFPLYTIAVQNAVPYRLMGVATSSTQFFRAIGGTLGMAVLGSVMTNRFASALLATTPSAVKQALPTGQLDGLAHNPQALMSTEAQAKLQDQLAVVGPQGSELLTQLLDALKQALSSAIGEVFLIGLIVVAVAFIATAFLRDVPHHGRPEEDSSRAGRSLGG